MDAWSGSDRLLVSGSLHTLLISLGNTWLLIALGKTWLSTTRVLLTLCRLYGTADWERLFVFAADRDTRDRPRVGMHSVGGFINGLVALHCRDLTLVSSTVLSGYVVDSGTSWRFVAVFKSIDVSSPPVGKCVISLICDVCDCWFDGWLSMIVVLDCMIMVLGCGGAETSTGVLAGVYDGICGWFVVISRCCCLGVSFCRSTDVVSSTRCCFM